MIPPRSLLPFGLTLLTFSSSTAAYSLAQSYDSTNFFDEFTFFTASDPTNGYVDYVAQSVATTSHLSSDAVGAAPQSLALYQSNQVYMGVDTTTYAPAGGRESVRLFSNQAWGEGLFIADIAHMPVGCGTWPAFWMFGPNWPYGGEIDIIEGVNNQPTNSITLHTGPGCTVSNTGSQSGTYTITSDCNTDDAYEGCSVGTGNSGNFGTGFNAGGGGTYAMQWASTGIYVWFWPAGEVPSDIVAGQPNTWGWGQPLATFTDGDCDFNTMFNNQNIIFDTTFCGSWAGSVWGSSECSALAPTCEEYVANNPSAFVDAYWLINSVKVYQ